MSVTARNAECLALRSDSGRTVILTLIAGVLEIEVVTTDHEVYSAVLDRRDIDQIRGWLNRDQAQNSRISKEGEGPGSDQISWTV